MKLLIIAAALTVLLSTSVLAHIPQLVLEDRDYSQEPVIVLEPQVSFAYYGRLHGSPQFYRIDVNSSFDLYVSLLAPYVGQESSDIEFRITKDGQVVASSEGFSNWTKWYEEYGGDWYLQGPEYEQQAGPGTYMVEVYSETNTEEYSLAIGREERFGSSEILWTIAVLPVMKALFWGNYILAAIYTAIITSVIYLSFRLVRRKRRKAKF